MASRGRRNGGGGCAVIFVVLVAIAAVVWLLSSVGSILGLTPTFTEVSDRPEGWVSRHYAGVFWGYVLTILLIAAAAAVVWLAVSSQGTDEMAAARARYLLPRLGGAGLFLLVVAIALPIGPRSNAQGNVPNVVGVNAAEAKAALDGASLAADFGDGNPVDEERCTVVEQAPEGGSGLDEFETVKLGCTVGVPRVVGKKAETAQTRVQAAGFETRLVNEPADYDLSRCRVRSQKPTGGVTPYSTVSLRLKCKKRRPERFEPLPEEPLPDEPSDENCDPNYSGACVPVYPPDVDCEDVDGPVVVTGDDVHELDREGDQRACE